MLKRGNVGFVTLKLEIVRWIVLNNKTKTKTTTKTKTKRANVDCGILTMKKYSVLLPLPSSKPWKWQNSFYEIFIVDSVIKSNSLVKIIALSQSPTTLQKLKRLNAFTKWCLTVHCFLHLWVAVALDKAPAVPGLGACLF